MKKEQYGAVFGPIRNRRTFEEVSDRLKELIFNGTLQPGQQLPSEHALAQLFQVGRQSVREALRVLELSGFIKVRPGVKGGAVIEATVLSKMAGLFLDTIKLHKISLVDCMEARKAIESSVLMLAMTNADQTDIENLRDNIVRARRKLQADKSAYEENIDFHRILANASKNYTFSIVMESILAVFADFKSRHEGVEVKQSMHITTLHEAIVDAMVAKNAKNALELLDKDLSFAEEILLGDTQSA
ncbi:MAG: Pyruvate dehydrogenase complex repressor [Syntrophorhabdaceae bacterium PtaU1.Bin034]|nr:MAG: Pyruvate dehydrogenase complex repressor [Syntrophorhabdaceae bacterium PtaU1.Bin034]